MVSFRLPGPMRDRHRQAVALCFAVYTRADDRPPSCSPIGAELLLGETVDTNAAFLGAGAGDARAFRCAAVRMLPDDRAVLRDAFAEARRTLVASSWRPAAWARRTTT